MRSELHRLFFAVRPPPDVASAIEGVAGKAKAAGLAHGHWLRAAKYHITVQFLGTFERWPDDMITRATAGAAALRFAPFEIVLDRIASFRGRRQAPCVLRCAADSEAVLQAFWRELNGALANAGLDVTAEQKFVPHLTLAYADRIVPEEIPIEPLVWVAGEFLLIASHVGTSIREPLGSWQLRP